MFRILIVEDDQKIAGIVESHLQRYGYEARRVTDFQRIKEEFEGFQADLIIMDINLPLFDGFYWCRQIRTISLVPIIFLSARSGDMDQVFALENGGDDYVTKPFSLEVLLAKVQSVLRRTYGEYAKAPATTSLLEANGLALDETRNLVKWEGRQLELSVTEFRLLRCLIRQVDRIVAREVLLEELWDNTEFVDDNTLNVNVARVRKRLEELGLFDVIKTKRGQGYMLTFATGEQHD